MNDMTKQQELELKKLACKARMGVLTSTHGAKAGHPGGSLSAAELFTLLYFEEMNIDPKDPKKPDRDRFVLSSGHGSMLLYSLLHLFGYGLTIDDLKSFLDKLTTNNEKSLVVTNCTITDVNAADIEGTMTMNLMMLPKLPSPEEMLNANADSQTDTSASTESTAESEAE